LIFEIMSIDSNIEVLAKAGITVDDVDIFEINEVYCTLVSSMILRRFFHKIIAYYHGVSPANTYRPKKFEAFASQATYCIEHLKIPMEKLNPKGGAIALGHPLGATGARQVATLYPELKRQNKRIGVISMCIGTGMGAAGVFERE